MWRLHQRIAGIAQLDTGIGVDTVMLYRYAQFMGYATTQGGRIAVLLFCNRSFTLSVKNLKICLRILPQVCYKKTHMMKRNDAE